MKGIVVTQNNKPYVGKLEESIITLEQEGFTPLSAQELMAYRIQSWDSQDKRMIDLLCNQSYAVNESLVTHPDGRVKCLRETPSNLLVSKRREDGGIVLEEEMFDHLEGKTFSQKEVEEYTNYLLDERVVCANPFWNFFVQGNKRLLREYNLQVLSELGVRAAMSVRLEREPSKYVVLRPFVLTRVPGSESAMDALNYGRYDLCNSRVIGKK